jgi:hypothetical protein
LLGARTDFASFSALPLAFSAVHSGISKANFKSELQKQKTKGESQQLKTARYSLAGSLPLAGG